MPSADQCEISLCLLPEAGAEGIAQSYDVYLVNTSAADLHVDFQWLEHGQVKAGQQLPLQAGQIAQVHHTWLDNLHAAPGVKVSCWLAQSLPGIERQFDKELRLRTKILVKPPQTLPFFARPVHVIPLWDRLPAIKTVQTASREKKWNKPKDQPTTLSDVVQRKAHLRTEIDLHAEALGIDPKGVSKHEVIQLQLRAFDEWLDDVIRHGFDTVYAIHGDGKGTLKKLIHQKLETWPHIASYNNRYHPKYGTGATEIHID